MTFGLDAAHVRQLVAGVSADHELDDDQVADRFARAAWTVVAEPGDGIAGALITSIGAAEALRLALDWSSPDKSRSGVSTDLRPAVAAHAASETTPGARDESDREQLDQAMQRWRPRLRSVDVERALRVAAVAAVRLLVPDRGGQRGTASDGQTAGDSDTLWLPGVDDLGAHAPAALWARGDVRRLHELRYAVALVGARAASGYGEHVAGEISAGLVELGFPIVSGAAYGIDGMAHRAALAAGGLTVAFLAGGVDRFYPAGHDQLLRRVVDSGLVLSELPCGAAPTKWRFLQRNRLIAASAAATVVVEAGARSGSLNTAGHASALGRPLGAVPGPITSPASAGCHKLLREYDAVCVTSAGEVAELTGVQRSARVGGAGSAPRSVGSARVGGAQPRDSAEVVRTLDALSTRAGRTADELARRTGMSPPSVLAVLGVLSIEGRAQDCADGWRLASRR